MLSRCADIAAAAVSNDYECSNITMVCKVPTARAWSKSSTAAARHVYLDSSYGGGGLSAYRLLLDFDGGFGGGGSAFTQIVRMSDTFDIQRVWAGHTYCGVTGGRLNCNNLLFIINLFIILFIILLIACCHLSIHRVCFSRRLCVISFPVARGTLVCSTSAIPKVYSAEQFHNGSARYVEIFRSIFNKILKKKQTVFLYTLSLCKYYLENSICYFGLRLVRWH